MAVALTVAFVGCTADGVVVTTGLETETDTETGTSTDATSDGTTETTVTSATQTASTVGPTTTTTGPGTTAAPGCGNGIVEADEECDDGRDNDDAAACTARCKNAVCGDGLLHVGVELCDDGRGNGAAYGACRDDCQGLGPHCGDGVLQEEHETCDVPIAPEEGPHPGCLSTCQQAASCLELLDDGEAATGAYLIQPEGAPDALAVHCDMDTDGGGYTFLKKGRDTGDGQYTASDAEADCAASGLRLLTPRSSLHLLAAHAVALDPAIAPVGSDEVMADASFLKLLAIYPETPGESCAGAALNSDACPQWVASDNGPYWVADTPIEGQPAAFNCAGCSMAYTWSEDGTVNYYEAFTNNGNGATSFRWICAAGDKTP